MSNFGNFGTALGQSGMTTMINPFFDLNGPFVAQQYLRFNNGVAYYPAPMYSHKKKKEDMAGMHGASRGYRRGYVGTIPTGVLGR